MNQGDALYIALDYKVNGESITENQFDEIEFCIGENRYLLSEGQIVWNEDAQKYYIFVNQLETFKLQRNPIEYQLRLRKGEEVISTPVEKLTVGKTISTKRI